MKPKALQSWLEKELRELADDKAAVLRELSSLTALGKPTPRANQVLAEIAGKVEAYTAALDLARGAIVAEERQAALQATGLPAIAGRLDMICGALREAVQAFSGALRERPQRPTEMVLQLGVERTFAGYVRGTLLRSKAGDPTTLRTFVELARQWSTVPEKEEA